MGPIWICKWKVVLVGVVWCFLMWIQANISQSLWMLARQAYFMGLQCHQHSEYLDDSFVLSSLTLKVVSCLSSTEGLALFTFFTSSSFSMGQVQKRLPVSVRIVVWYYEFLEDRWLNSFRLKRAFISDVLLRVGCQMEDSAGKMELSWKEEAVLLSRKVQRYLVFEESIKLCISVALL